MKIEPDGPSIPMINSANAMLPEVLSATADVYKVSPMWAHQHPIGDRQELLLRLRDSGLPLGGSPEEILAGASAGPTEIVCIAEVRAAERTIHALVVSPSGIMFHFAPPPGHVDPKFWRFAAEYYYWLTGNLADRRVASELIEGHPFIKSGMAVLSRGKGDAPSGASIGDLLNKVAPKRQLLQGHACEQLALL